MKGTVTIGKLKFDIIFIICDLLGLLFAEAVIMNELNLAFMISQVKF